MDESGHLKVEITRSEIGREILNVGLSILEIL